MSALARKHVVQRFLHIIFGALSNTANAKTPYSPRSPSEHTAYLTLIAEPIYAQAGLEWNAILQGIGETVFFDV
jgi:hypothetical protein